MKNRLWYSNIFFWPRGHWKTLQAVIDAYECHKKGMTIISNIWLNFPHIRFTNSEELCEIMEEIGQYCNEVVLPSEWPDALIKDYGVKRKKAKTKRKKFFILWDEIGKHLNSRNWTRNFKDNPLLLDMLTEPRKYWLTIVGITQSWKMIDAHFRFITTEWFLMQKKGWWIFERLMFSKYYVADWEFDPPWEWLLAQKWSSILLSKHSQFTHFNSALNAIKKLYWTWEIVGAGLFKWEIPHKFKKWDIHKSKGFTVVPVHTDTVPESSE